MVIGRLRVLFLIVLVSLFVVAFFLMISINVSSLWLGFGLICDVMVTLSSYYYSFVWLVSNLFATVQSQSILRDLLILLIVVFVIVAFVVGFVVGANFAFNYLYSS